MAEVMQYISKLTVPERLQVMEMLWDSLSSADYESPQWHENILRDREQRAASGQSVFMSLEESKRLLAERFRAC
jgi:hypothetical protein